MNDRRVTDKDRKIALVWDYLRKVHAPHEVKSAFRELVIKNLVTGVEDNQKFWQPKYGRDEYLEE